MSQLKRDKPVFVSDLISAMQELAPQELAEPWDTVGLQIGDPHDTVQGVLLTLDLTKEALQQAQRSGCNLIICHHPLIFHPLPALRRDDPAQAFVMRLIEHKMNVLIAHTNLDLAPGGVADCLADSLCRQLPVVEKEENHAEGVQHEGIRYGRLIRLKQKIPLSFLIRTCQSLSGRTPLINTDQEQAIQTLIAFPGSFSEEWVEAVRLSGPDCVLCGEAKHHLFVELGYSNIVLICIGHDVSERVVLEPLAKRLSRRFQKITFDVYAGLDYNKDCFQSKPDSRGCQPKGGT